MGKYRTGRPYLTVVNGSFTYNVMKAFGFTALTDFKPTV